MRAKYNLGWEKCGIYTGRTTVSWLQN